MLDLSFDSDGSFRFSYENDLSDNLFRRPFQLDADDLHGGRDIDTQGLRPVRHVQTARDPVRTEEVYGAIGGYAIIQFRFDAALPVEAALRLSFRPSRMPGPHPLPMRFQVVLRPFHEDGFAAINLHVEHRRRRRAAFLPAEIRTALRVAGIGSLAEHPDRRIEHHVPARQPIIAYLYPVAHFLSLLRFQCRPRWRLINQTDFPDTRPYLAPLFRFMYSQYPTATLAAITLAFVIFEASDVVPTMWTMDVFLFSHSFSPFRARSISRFRSYLVNYTVYSFASK